MKNEKESVIIVLVFFCILILLSLYHCETIQRRESDWRRWAEEAEELGYNRGYEDGYQDGCCDRGDEYWDGQEDGYAAGYADGYRDALKD